MNLIAKDVELSKATLYLYFKNKQSLYFAVVIKGMVILRDMFKKAVKIETTGLGKVLSIIQAYFDYMQVHSNYYRLNLSARAPRFTKMLQNDEDEGTKIENAEEYIELTKELLGLLTNAVTLGIKDGTIRSELDPLQTVMFLGAAIEATVHISPEYQLLIDMYGMTAEGYHQHSINVLLRGIAGEKIKIKKDIQS